MNTFKRYCLTAAIAAVSVVNTHAADIVDTAVGAGSFNTLVAAAKAAGLVDTLKGDGPLTVFAPTDDAFAKLPEGTVETLLKPENKSRLAAILTYHVVPGKVMASDVVKLSGAKTVEGQQVDIKVDGSTVMVDGATVVKTDIGCDNGVIHVIDSVILPADKNIVETAVGAGSFKTLVAAVKAAGLAETLSGEGPFTVFAPTDEAFAKLPAGTVETLLKPENKQKLVDILTYHVVSGRVYSSDAVAAKTAKTLNGSSITVKVGDSGAMINDAGLVTTDIDGSNGVIHVIDSVLMPPAKGANVQGVLHGAIAQGSELFNSGHHAACADLYTQTLSGLMSADMDPSLHHHMTSVMATASTQQCPTTRAWTLRHGMDQMYSRLAAK
ncbi:Uncaracterized surface protein containing fasciclin (FAS1) repeats [Neorhodopirellula lusitana]|uniref:Uncaracterized surface protein containing fasciclin (FAS1) repeats n=1 Tax=Neorhodopirellula lusitana TaxID=445327 RepID=A0ABY1QBH8_9BACT|nr:fasciclin domain-containing protein [Neorhodopirellula lusitana]SMP66607.1 Uncaracterized surface protein containing fasciclin (FAS1) repeats [Neorhodopirellula lusitana]